MNDTKIKKRHQLVKAIQLELREHKSSFIVFTILRFLVIVVFIRQIFLHNYESVFLCLVTLFLMYIPSWVQVKMRIEIPPALEITILCFIFAAEIMGEIGAFYVMIPFWDTILHTLNGFLAAAVGFSMVVILNNNEKLTFELSPVFMALTAFCFSMTIGVLWEFLEFSMDMIFKTDMQKDTIVTSIHTIMLDTTRSNKVVSIDNIKDVVIDGKPLGIEGYIDIGLIDTIKDMFVNFIGAVVFSVSGFFYAKSQGKKKTPAQNFVPIPKSADKDFLKKIENQDECGDKE